MPALVEPAAPRPPMRGRIARSLWVTAGLVCVGIGLVGLALPLLPTTDFMVLALLCFARGSPRLERWLIDHPLLGPPLRAWRDHRAIPRYAKVAACVGMALSFTLFVWSSRPHWPVALGVGGGLLAVAVWIVRRPGQGSVAQ